ncbi:uncharacterized protein LOC111334745 [Stylophora pistillata]|uniref:uncharacterized protein LOC111334745 n=1 Tax=Stylophora pistillata TaxID=50429 RepID=UPI000C04DFE1|nr:uncharacterized protein LOC111334745 [Stylophora pistillata]
MRLDDKYYRFLMVKKHNNAVRKLLVWLTVITYGVAEECEKLDQCSCKKGNGKIISLWDIDGGSKEPAFKGLLALYPPGSSYKFDWNPCTKFSEGTGCSNVFMCETTSYSTYADSVNKFVVESDGTTTIVYNKIETGGRERTVTINLKCDKNKYPGQMDGVTVKETTSASLTSKCACEDSCRHPDFNRNTGNTGLSTGSILLIVFFPLLLVYFMAGLLYNKYHKGVNSFPEMIPNHSFWGEFPLLVKDGCVFTFERITRCCQRLFLVSKRDSYEEI